MSASLMDWRWCRTGVFVIAVAAGPARSASGQSAATPEDAKPATVADAATDAATRKLVAAHGLFQRGLFELASQGYADFLSEYPKHPQRTAALYALAICQYRQNDFERAATLLTSVLKDAAFEQRSEALAVLGHCELSRQRYEKAVAAFDELLAKDRGGVQAESAAMNRAQALYLWGKHDGAGEACAAFLRDYPKSIRCPAALYVLALSQRAREQNADVVATVERLLREFPGSPLTPDAALVAGQSLEAQGKFDEAAEQYRRMLAAAPPERKGDAYYSIGAALYKAGNYDEAVRALSRVEGGASLKAARLQLGLAQLAANRTGEARATLRAIVRDEAENPAARYGLARCDMADKQFESARKILSELLEAKPANAPQVALDRAVCLMELGKFEGAATEFAALAAQQGAERQSAEALYRQAFCLHKLAKFDKSHEICMRLTGAKPPAELARPLAELDAENLFALGKYADAARAFDALAGGAKDDERALRLTLRRGQCAYFGGDYARAVDVLSALAADPRASAAAELTSAIFLLGDSLLQQGKNAAAAESLTKFLDAAKGDQAEAAYKLALARLRNNDLAGAEKMLAQLARGPDDSPWVQRGLVEYGQLLLKSGKGQQAAAALDRVLAAKAPPDLAASALYLIAWVHFDSKQFTEAATFWKRLADEHPKHALAAEAAYQRGIALKEAGENAQAAAALEEFAVAHPQSPNAATARQLAAACLTAAGKYDDAAAVLASLAVNPKAGDTVLYDLAWSQRAQKKDADASETYRRLLKEHPDSKLAGAASAELAEFLYAAKKYDEASQLLERVVADESVDGKLRSASAYRLGWCYQKLGKSDRAAEAFAKVDPKLAVEEAVAASAILQAGLAHAESGRFDKAELSLARVLKEYPKDSQAAVAMLKLGEVQAELGKYDDSGRTYAAYLDKHPNEPFAGRAHFGIGWAAENGKNYEDARIAYKKAIAADAGETAARAQFQIGETFLAEGKFEQGIPALLAVEDVYAYPKWSARALVEAGRAFEELKRPADARKQYETVVAKYNDTPEAALARERLKHVAP